jgi:hypothetical protein
VVQHFPKHGGEARTVQPVTTEPTVSCEGSVGVVIHLSKRRRNGQNFIHRTDTTTKLNINLNDKKLTQFCKARQILI